MNGATNLTGTTAAWAARILNRDLIELETTLANHPSLTLARRVAAVRGELSELQTAANR